VVLPEVVFRRTYTGPVPLPDDGVDTDAGDHVTRSLPDQGSFFLVNRAFIDLPAEGTVAADRDAGLSQL
jgi:hypothetical protein